MLMQQLTTFIRNYAKVKTRNFFKHTLYSINYGKLEEMVDTLEQLHQYVPTMQGQLIYMVQKSK